MKKIILLLSLFTVGLSAFPRKANPLFVAAYQGDLQRVKELVAGGANIDERNGPEPEWEGWLYDGYVGLTPIYGAIYSRNIDVINFLIEKGADLNAGRVMDPYSSPLAAAIKIFPRIANRLIRHGARFRY